MAFELGKMHRPITLLAFLVAGSWGFAQVSPLPQVMDAAVTKAVTPRFAVVDGYLVAHLPEENVTVIAQAPVAGPVGVDQGWATWTQRADMLWRGQMEDSQGRSYNIRILPGYVAPWRYGTQGWSDAASNLGEYGQARTWRKLGRDSRSCFKWGWEDSLWEFGIEGSGKAWSRNFEMAKRRVQRKTFGWPLAYPWATVSASFETLIRVPLGAAGAVVGTAAGAVVVPAFQVASPSIKAVYHAGIDGVLLPVSGWAWQTMAAPPAALLASAPTPSRADGVWMKVVEPRRETAAPVAAELPRLSDASMDILARYALEAAHHDAREAEAHRLEQDELKAVRTRHAEARRQLQESRSEALLAWSREPDNQKALLALLQEGGDAASIRAQREALAQRLTAMNLSEAQAMEILRVLVRHPLRERAPSRPAVSTLSDKTDPVRGALETVDRVTGTRIVP
ncbi:hypothetical protein [Holophaga foetida]|uniref:hypothetical protein n=1 Tax=Holophaga foetida TaxID=35839 RepID=UPI0002471C6C|nr:hypothetical protein [Holophaga foetida]